MRHEPKIAIIHPDTLAAIGLKHMLQEVMPIVKVDICRSVGEIPNAEIDDYIHYFASTGAIAADLHFFTEHRRKTIVLNSSPESSSSPFTGFHCLNTSVPEKQLVRSLLALEQAAHADGRNLPPSVTACSSGKHLSAREIEVMTLIVKGLINKEIADRLNISLTTTITHRRNIMDKLNIKSVSALTIYAVTHGYVDIGDI